MRLLQSIEDTLKVMLILFLFDNLVFSIALIIYLIRILKGL